MILQSRPEFGEGLAIVVTPHALRNFKKAQRILSDPYRALPLIRVHPIGDFAKVLAWQAVDVLGAVRRLEGAVRALRTGPFGGGVSVSSSPSMSERAALGLSSRSSLSI